MKTKYNLNSLFFCCFLFLYNGSFSQTTCSVNITQSVTINSSAKKLLGITFDARSSCSITTGTVVTNIGYFFPATGSVIPSMQPLLNRIPFNTVRYPANPVMANWNWSLTVGPTASRVAQPLGPGIPSQKMEFGFDEFMAYALSRGVAPADVQIMVNLYTVPGFPNPAIQAADWVEYANAPLNTNPRGGIDWAQIRSNNGHPLPYGIKIWNIGNEPWSYTELNSTVSSPTDYIAIAGPIIDSMKAADPTIQITIPAVGNSASPWNNAILTSSLVPKIYGLSPHAFYDEDNSTLNPSINSILPMISNLANATATMGLKVIAGDHASFAPTSNPDVAMQWKGALTTADYLLMISQISNIERANFWVHMNTNAAWHPVRKNPNGSHTFMAAAQLYETFTPLFLDQSLQTTITNTTGGPVNFVRASTFISNNALNEVVIVANTDTLIDHTVLAPTITGYNLQQVKKIFAPTFYSDTSTTIVVSPISSNLYAFDKATVLVFEYINASANIANNGSNLNEFTLYPNPANKTLYFTKEINNAVVFNLLGEKIFEKKGKSMSIPVENFNEGVYFLNSDKHKIKFIVKH